MGSVHVASWAHQVPGAENTLAAALKEKGFHVSPHQNERNLPLPTRGLIFKCQKKSHSIALFPDSQGCGSKRIGHVGVARADDLS